jgi:hypothetical protein
MRQQKQRAPGCFATRRRNNDQQSQTCPHVAVAAHRLRSVDRSTAIYVMNKYDILLVETRI